MKFKVTMKDPDGVHESIRQATKASAENVDGLSDDEREELIERRTEDYGEALSPWFEYEEYLTVEIDTEAGTCVVVKP